MTSKDYLKQIAESKGVCPLTNEVKDNALLFPIGFEKIFQDLDRLEELENENIDLKDKVIHYKNKFSKTHKIAEKIKGEVRRLINALDENLIRMINDNHMDLIEIFDIFFKELNALEIIKNKKVNLFHIWVFNDYEQYKEHYPFAEYNAEEDMLSFEEFDLLKEVLEE